MGHIGSCVSGAPFSDILKLLLKVCTASAFWVSGTTLSKVFGVSLLVSCAASRASSSSILSNHLFYFGGGGRRGGANGVPDFSLNFLTSSRILASSLVFVFLPLHFLS